MEVDEEVSDVVTLTKVKLEVVLEAEDELGVAGEVGLVDRMRPGALREIKMKGKTTNSPIPLASVKYYKFSVLLKAGGCHHLYIFCFSTNLPFEIL